MLIRKFLRLGRVGWYVVVKGRIRAYFLSYFISLDLTSHLILSTRILALSLARRPNFNLLKFSSNDVSNELVLRRIFDPWWVARRLLGLLDQFGVKEWIKLEGGSASIVFAKARAFSASRDQTLRKSWFLFDCAHESKFNNGF